jgi:hypothetical protein
MKRIKILEAVGYKYIINKATKEIHYVPKINNACGVQNMRHGRYVSKKKAYRLIKKKGYNGCIHCFRECNED